MLKAAKLSVVYRLTDPRSSSREAGELKVRNGSRSKSVVTRSFLDPGLPYLVALRCYQTHSAADPVSCQAF